MTKYRFTVYVVVRRIETYYAQKYTKSTVIRQKTLEISG